MVIYEVRGDGCPGWAEYFASEVEARACHAKLEADEREFGIDEFGGHYRLERIELPATAQAMCAWLNSLQH